MNRSIFVNLPIKNLARSKPFFEALGYRFNPQFTSNDSGCLVISDSIYAMLLEEARFAEFCTKPISDAHQATEVLIALSCESRAEVDDMVRKAVAAGGKAYRQPVDHGFMYGHGFEDLDGHIWEVFYMDPSHIKS